MSDIEPIYYPGNLNPAAPAFLPANLHPVPFFLPTRIYFPLPPPLFFPNFAGPPPLLQPTPTRAVMLLEVPPDFTESSVRRYMEMFGEVRGVEMERANEGMVTVHYYDLRDAERAVREIEQIRLHGGRFVWAHFVFPHLKAVPQGNNQGSLVLMNLEPTVSSTTLRHIFQLYGEVKELRETPHKREQRFVEFFDVRDAAKALRDMNGKSISGKPVVVQFSRPGGLRKKLFLDSQCNRSGFFNHPGQFRGDRRKGPVKKSDFSTSEHQQKNSKNRKKNLSDACFILNEDGDSRTTVMIKNIPNKYNLKLFLETLDMHCDDCNQKIITQGNNAPISSYDFVYLPIDFRNKCNVGYGFVNMTTPEAVWRLYKEFHNQRWGLFNSRKICEVTYARLQGVESLKEHFKNWRLPGVDIEKYTPVLFLPPRDGRLLTEPISIVDQSMKTGVDSSCHSDGDTVQSCLLGSDGCLGERTQNGGVWDDESKTVVN